MCVISCGGGGGGEGIFFVLGSSVVVFSLTCTDFLSVQGHLHFLLRCRMDLDSDVLSLLLLLRSSLGFGFGGFLMDTEIAPGG